MKLACTGEKRAPPTARPLQPAASNSRPAESPGGIGEDAAEGAHALGLGGPAMGAELGEACGDGVPVAGTQVEPRRGDHLARADGRAAVAERQVVPVHPPAPVGAADDRPAEHLRQLARVGAGVHRHRAAHGARDAGAELEPLEPVRGRALHRPGQGGAPAAPEVVAAHRDRRQASHQPQHQAAEALVRDQQVGAAPDDGDRGARLAGPRQGRHHAPERGGPAQPVGRSPDADGGERSERSVGLQVRQGRCARDRSHRQDVFPGEPPTPAPRW